MKKTSQFNTGTYDWVAISLYIGLVLIGWMMLYAAVYEKDTAPQLFTFGSTIGSQTIWIIISFITFWLVTLVDWKIWNTFTYPLYGIAIALLLLVLLIGSEIKGARSWFRIGSLSFQPAEFAKLATTLALAAYLSYYKTDLRKYRSQLIAISIVLAPIFLTLLQPDAGSALIFVSFGIVLYREGLPPIYFYILLSLAGTFILTLMFNPWIVFLVLMIMVGILYIAQLSSKRNGILILMVAVSVAVFLWTRLSPKIIISACAVLIGLASVYMWSKRQRQLVTILLPSIVLLMGVSFGANFSFDNVLKPHQQDRINAWLKPQECDRRGSLYNIIQSKTAIGSGGLTGKGYLNGTMTELNHVPEQSTDFIFSIIGEEQGFAGVFTIIVLFSLLIYRIITIGERARNLFVRRYAYGLAGILFFHFFINIGMTMGICPVIGIPLPFLSKGGTALFFFSIMIGILVKMDYSRLKE